MSISSFDSKCLSYCSALSVSFCRHTVRILRSNELNNTEKVLVPLKPLGKGSLKLGIIMPTAQLALPVFRPCQVTPLFFTSFSQRFEFCHCFFNSTLPFIELSFGRCAGSTKRMGVTP